MLQAFETPFTLGDETLALRVSVGIAVTEAHDERADDLLTHADVAMYRAKQSGGDGLAMFDSTLRARANERVSLARDLRAAIGTDQLSLHYQPIVDLSSQRVTSVEALVRWEHPVRGQVPPDEFVRLAEDTGVIVELGRWVLERACTEFAAALDEAGDKRIELAVNLSPRQLADLGLPVLLRDIMARTGLGRGRVALEITETALTDDADNPADRLWALKQEGVRIVLDDFGSGYSSLGHLRRFPIDAIKIDRSFVEGLGTQSRDAAIVGAILPMARALDLDVVAEGVETESKLAHLYALGCRQAQGYLFARPAPMAEIAPLVRKAGSTSADRPAHPELGGHQATSRRRSWPATPRRPGRVIREALGRGLRRACVQAQVIGPALAYIGDEWELGRLGRRRRAPGDRDRRARAGDGVRLHARRVRAAARPGRARGRRGRAARARAADDLRRAQRGRLRDRVPGRERARAVAADRGGAPHPPRRLPDRHRARRARAAWWQWRASCARATPT